MKKFLYLLLIPFAFACGTDTENSNKYAADVPGVYSGNYNCNGCDIGKWVVNLKDDQSFKITYFDKKTKDLVKSVEGTYTIENGQIALASEDLEKPHVFDIVNKNSIKTDLGRVEAAHLKLINDKRQEFFVAQALPGQVDRTKRQTLSLVRL